MNEISETAEDFDMVVWEQEWAKPNLSGAEKYWLLKSLFKYQMKQLDRLRFNCAMPERKGFDSRAVQLLAKIQHEVLKLAMEICVSELFPFQPVIPRAVMDYYSITRALSRLGEQWDSRISFNKVFDIKVKGARSTYFPYFIFNIDKGPEGFSPKENIARISARKFNAFDFAEALVFPMNTGNANKPFFIFSGGSMYGDANFVKSVPGLYKKDQDAPSLTWVPMDEAREGWICPSFQTYRRAVSLRGFFSPKGWVKFGTWQRIRQGFRLYRKPSRLENDDNNV